MTAHWYLLQTKPHKEEVVRARLEARGVVVFLPMMAVTPVNPRAASRRPCYPGYLFVAFDPDLIGPDTVGWTPGSVGLVRAGADPLILTRGAMQRVRAHAASLQSTDLPPPANGAYFINSLLPSDGPSG